MDGAIDAGTYETSLADLLQDGLVSAFPPAHERREDEQAAGFRQCGNHIHNLLG